MNKKFTLSYTFGTFSVLVIYAILYVKERVIYTDSANYVFFITQTKTFFTPHYRFISVLFEIPAVIGVQLKLSLMAILYCYSLGNFIPDIIVLFILLFILRDYTKSISVVLLWLLSNNFDFYYTATELYKSFFILILLWSLLDNWIERTTEITAGKSIVILTLVTVIVWSHPLTFFCLLFLFFYFFSKKHNKVTLKWMLIFAGFVLLSILIKLLFFNVEHENSKFKLAEKCIELFPCYFSTTMAKSFWNYQKHQNFIFVIVVLINIVLLTRRKKWMKLLVYVSFSLGFWILVTASYNEQHYDYYIEHLYKPISFFTILMFTDEFIQEVKNKNIVVVCLLLISIVSLAKIRHGRHVFQQKLQKIEKILDVMSKHHIDKAYFHNDNFRPMLNDDRWNMVVESLLYSACKRKEQSKTFEVTYDTKAVRDFIHNDNTIFFQEGTKMPLIQLNSDYYSLSNSNYIQIDSLLNKNE